MKKKAKIAIIIGTVTLLTLVLLANIWRHRSTVRDVRVDIEYGSADTLVRGDDVATMIKNVLPDITSIMLRNVDLRAVEDAAAQSPYLSHCQAATTIGGEVVIFAEQRHPIVRICANNKEYYLDTEGKILPLSPVGDPDIIVASGNIKPKAQGANHVWQLALYLHSHPEVGVLFDQIYRSSSGDLYLTPKIGNHVVEIGTPNNLPSKFHNLMALYTRGLPQAGWETYSKVSVKYRDQVVCTRRQ